MRIAYNPTASDIFFASDAHFFHKRVIEFDERPFADLDEMHETLIENWNRVVRPQDLVFYLGDLCFGGITRFKEVANRLNGIIHFITGNHDDYKIVLKSGRFLTIQHYKEIWVQEEGLDPQFICLMHYPIQQWNRMHSGSYMIHGHCHHTLKDLEFNRTFRILDAGLNGHDYTPLSYAQVKEFMGQREICPSTFESEEEDG